MNKYDDIKQFKEKLNLEHIDYKDTSENDVHMPSQEWAILRQVAVANGAADDHAALQRIGGLPASPIPASKEEFGSASLLQAVSQQLPASRDSAAADQPAVSIERATVPVASPQPEPVSTSARTVDDATGRADDKPRFQSLFRQKNASVDENDKRRNTPLKPLLETIALCR